MSQSETALDHPTPSPAPAIETERREPFVDAKVAAAFLKISPRTLLAMSRAGQIPAHPLDGEKCRKTWRFLLSELDAWMRRGVESGESHSCRRKRAG